MQEATEKKVEELRQELEEQKRRAREEVDMFKKQIAEMQSKEEIAREEMVREHRQELEKQERRAREEADGLRKRISEMQSKLEEDRHTSGKASATYLNSRHLVGPCAHLAQQRIYPSSEQNPSKKSDVYSLVTIELHRE